MARKIWKNRPAPLVVKYAADQASPLVRYLNQPTGSAAVRDRVQRIFENARQLDALAESAPALPLPPAQPSGYSEYEHAVRRRLDALNADLRAFRFVPSLSGGPDPYWVSWLPLRKQRFTGPEVKRAQQTKVVPVSPFVAVKAILQLTAVGAVDRIIQCPMCHCWHFRRSEKRDVCSDRCRKRRFRDPARFREAHRAYMAEYRAGRREEVAALAKERQRRRQP